MMATLPSSNPMVFFSQLAAVIPGWSEGPDRRCAIAHRGISRFRVRAIARPGMTSKSPQHRFPTLDHRDASRLHLGFERNNIAVLPQFHRHGLAGKDRRRKARDVLLA